MATITARPVREFGPGSAGTMMTPEEFDRADFKEGWRYELIHGVLIVTPSPLENERDPNEELGHWLRNYKERHPQGSILDKTLPEQTVRPRRQRRRADRVIWTGLGHLPRKRDVPSIIAEFVSAGKRDRKRDYREKRDEYMRMGVKEYWIFDRFHGTMTVFSWRGGKLRKRVLLGRVTYKTPLLPGFELPLGRLFELASQWPEEEDDDI